MKQYLNFSEAMKAVEQCELVTCDDWNGKNMFIFLRERHVALIDDLKTFLSLSPKVKTYYAEKIASGEIETDKTVVKFGAYICLKTPDDHIQNGWTPSQSDMLSKKWRLYTKI
jgi:hypothetical protein